MMIKFGATVFTIIGFFVVSCNNKKNSSEEPKIDSIAGVKAIMKDDSLMITGGNLHKWIESALHKNGLDWSSLHLEEYAREEKHPAEPFTAAADFFKDYAEVLRWSPDSSYILDIGSYGSVLVKDKKGTVHVEAGEPDTEISIVDMQTKQKRRLFFVGPSSVIIDGTWADTTNVLILGSFDEHANNKPDTLFWLIDVNENFYRMYKWKR